MPSIVLATRNRHKVLELRQLLEGSGWNILSLDDIPPVPEVEETAESLEGNALRKAFLTARASGHPALADDSGLFVDAMEGEPGVQSSRFLGEETSYAAKNAEIIRRVGSDPLGRRAARFRCVVALVGWEEGWCEVFHGVVEGTIAHAPVGTGGFGYDPIFIPEGHARTFGEMSAEEKHGLSHRGKAVAKAVEFLRKTAIKW